VGAWVFAPTPAGIVGPQGVPDAFLETPKKCHCVCTAERVTLGGNRDVGVGPDGMARSDAHIPAQGAENRVKGIRKLFREGFDGFDAGGRGERGERGER